MCALTYFLHILYCKVQVAYLLDGLRGVYIHTRIFSFYIILYRKFAQFQMFVCKKSQDSFQNLTVIASLGEKTCEQSIILY